MGLRLLHSFRDKALTLEELDTTIDIGVDEFSAYHRKKLPWYMSTYVLRRDVELMEPLFELHEKGSHNDHA
jgi:hypothetical protein